MLVPEPIEARRVVTTPETLDTTRWPSGCLVLRTAPDEVLVLNGPVPPLSDPHALVEEEEGLVGVELSIERVREWLSREADWDITDAASLHQGMAAGIPVKIWVGPGRALILTRASLRYELERYL